MLPEVHDLIKYPMSDEDINTLHEQLVEETDGEITPASLASALLKLTRQLEPTVCNSGQVASTGSSGTMAGVDLKWVPLVSGASSVDEGMDLLFEADPAAFFLHGPQIKHMLEYRVRLPPLPAFVPGAARGMRVHCARTERLQAKLCIHVSNIRQMERRRLERYVEHHSASSKSGASRHTTPTATHNFEPYQVQHAFLNGTMSPCDTPYDIPKRQRSHKVRIRKAGINRSGTVGGEVHVEEAQTEQGVVPLGAA